MPAFAQEAGEQEEAAPASVPGTPHPLQPAPPLEVTPPNVLVPPEQVSSVRKALNVFRNKGKGGSSEEDYLSQITNNAKNAISRKIATAFIYPQFYMESLIYHAPNNWTVSINGRRYSAGDVADENNNLRVLKVDHEHAVIEWRPGDMGRIKSSLDAGSNPNVQVDFQAKTVVFPLRLNQTFSSYYMSAVEGKVTPLQAVDDGETELNPTPTPIPVDVAEPTEAPESTLKNNGAKAKSGLKALINSYENLKDQP